MARDDVPQFDQDGGEKLGLFRKDQFDTPASAGCLYPGTKQGEPFLVWKVWSDHKDTFATILDKYVCLAPHPAIARFVGYCEDVRRDLLVVTEGDFSRICSKVFGRLGETQPPPELDATRKAKAIFGAVAALVHMESQGIRPYLNLEENIMFDRNWEVKVAYAFSDVAFAELNFSSFWYCVFLGLGV